MLIKFVIKIKVHEFKYLTFIDQEPVGRINPGSRCRIELSLELLCMLVLESESAKLAASVSWIHLCMWRSEWR